MFQKGDTVKVKEDACEIETNLYWHKDMNKFLGNKYMVRKIYNSGITLEECLEPGKSVNAIDESEYWLFHPCWLEKSEIAIDISEDEYMNIFL